MAIDGAEWSSRGHGDKNKKGVERLSKVFSDSAHEVPAKFGHLASFNRKSFLGDTIVTCLRVKASETQCRTLVTNPEGHLGGCLTSYLCVCPATVCVLANCIGEYGETLIE